MEKRFQDHRTILTLLLYSVLLLGPATGFALGYDEAWRIVVSHADKSLIAFVLRWFPGGLPEPVSIPHGLLLRWIPFIENAENRILAFRLINLPAALIILFLCDRIARRFWGSRVARGSLFLLMSHAWFGANVVIIKEHIWLAAAILSWLDRATRLWVEARPLSGIDAVIIFSLVIISPLASIPVLCISLLFAGGWMRGRPWRPDALPLTLGILLVVAWTAAGMTVVRAMDRSILSYFIEHGVIMPRVGIEHGFVFGREEAGIRSVGECLQSLSSSSLMEPWGKITAGCALVFTLGSIIGSAARKRRTVDLALLAILLSPLALVTGFWLLTDVAAARMFIWLIPIMAIVISAVLLRSDAPYPRIAMMVHLALVIALLPGWLNLRSNYALNKRFDLVITRLGGASFRPDRDRIIHTSFFAYFPHEAINPGLEKGVMTDTREWHTQWLAPDFPMRRHAIPAGRAWNDARFESFKGGSIWTVECYETHPVLLARMRAHLFGGRNRVEEFRDWPYTWYRISAETDSK